MSYSHLRSSQQRMDGGCTNKGKTTVTRKMLGFSVITAIIISLFAAANTKLCRFQRLDAILTVKALAHPSDIRDKRAAYIRLSQKVQNAVLTSFIEEFFKFVRGGEGQEHGEVVELNIGGYKANDKLLEAL